MSSPIAAGPRPMLAASVESVPMRCRMAIAALVGICVLGATSPAVHAAPRRAQMPSNQPLALLLNGHLAHLHPQGDSRRVAAIAEYRPITGERTALPVIGVAQDSHGGRWLRVMLPGRPNGSTGWISRQGTSEVATPWRLTVELGARRVLVYRNGKLVRRFDAVIGKPSTPTPTGSFFVEETVKLGALEPGGPFALALSGRSDALREFDGGPGQIALHGRDGLGGTLRTAVSHGCIRLATASIDWLAERIGPGVPVKISQN